jgi:hypothetical protein
VCRKKQNDAATGQVKPAGVHVWVPADELSTHLGNYLKQTKARRARGKG